MPAEDHVMSEPPFSTPNKPSRGRKRPAKAEAVPEQSAAEPRPTGPKKPAATERPIALSLSAVDRDGMIRTAAYFRAQRRNFAPGHEFEDWLAAEAEIDAVRLEGGLNA